MTDTATDYTPTAGEVRHLYWTRKRLGNWGAKTPSRDAAQALGIAEFDRWLAAHDAEVAARSLEDAADALVESGWLVSEEARMGSAWLHSRATEIREGADRG